MLAWRVAHEPERRGFLSTRSFSRASLLPLEPFGRTGGGASRPPAPCGVLPEPELLNVISGLAEIVIGVFLLDRRTRPFAALGAIALLIAVFPANLYAAQANVGPEGPGTGAGAANWIRLPFQLVLAAWAWWYTLPEDSEAS